MIEHTVAGRPWYAVCVHYPSALQAKSAWERAERKLDMSAGDEGIGLTRLSPPQSTGVQSGCPQGAHPVIAVTLDRATAEKAERILRDGTSWEPVSGFLDSLVMRRCRVVLGNEGTGRIIVRRPDERGARIAPDGTLIESDPGQG